MTSLSTMLPVASLLHALQRLLEAAAGGCGRAAAAWRRREAQRHALRAENEALGLDGRLLRDIGAPEWLVLQAELRRDADRLRELARRSAWGEMR